jgi:hypothetical protein
MKKIVFSNEGTINSKNFNFGTYISLETGFENYSQREVGDYE